MRFKERKLLAHEVDTSSMEQMFEIYTNLGGLGQDSMQRELEYDFAQLQEIIGELDYEEMAVLKSTNPSLFIILIQKVFNFLMYLAHVPIKDENGEAAGMNLYEEAIDKLFEKNVVDGQVPDWLQKVKLCFDWGKKFAKIVEAAQSGLMADQLATEIVNELTDINISMFNTEGLDNMLL